MKNRKFDNLSDWLKGLGQESWHLELLISGFSILLLLEGRTALRSYLLSFPFFNDMTDEKVTLFFVLLGTLAFTSVVLLICLVLHLLFRGFWIGAIGLRSVQDGVDFDLLKYNSFFTEKLKKRIYNLDDVVVKLDEICSIIFSFSFLLISTLLAFGTFVLLIGFLNIIFVGLVGLMPFAESAIKFVAIVITMVVLVFGIIYFIDYLSLGFFKKIKWFSRIYFPFYWLFSYVTLAFATRSIYYHLISKFSKKRIRRVYLGLFALLFMWLLVEYNSFPYYTESSNALLIDNNNYDDQRDKIENTYISTASIPSQIIETPFLPLFIRYNPSDNEALSTICPDYDLKGIEGMNLKIKTSARKDGIHIISSSDSVSIPEESLRCQKELYKIYLNGKLIKDLKAYFYIHPKLKQKGIQYMIDSEILIRGENEIKIEKQRYIKLKEELEWTELDIIKFWYAGS